jgi:hypothetical protein
VRRGMPFGLRGDPGKMDVVNPGWGTHIRQVGPVESLFVCFGWYLVSVGPEAP